MKKLLKLKEWLPIEEAALHISNLLGEPVSVADIYRFAADGHLTLSVNFVNHAQAKKGRWVKTKQVQFNLIENDIFTGEKLSTPYALPTNHEIRVSEDDWIALENSVVSIAGVWDLPMVGEELLDVEHNYQQLTSGLEVTLTGLDGAFVQRDDIICQLQTDFDHNEFQKGSKAHIEHIEKYIANNNLADDEASKLREEAKANRAAYLKERDTKPRESHYFPSGGLAEHDHAFVVRTKELTRFIQSLEDEETEKPLSPKTENAYLRTIEALSNALIGGLTGTKTTDAEAVLISLDQKGIERPVEPKTLSKYLEAASNL